jgi:hypothetical protein
MKGLFLILALVLYGAAVWTGDYATATVGWIAGLLQAYAMSR